MNESHAKKLSMALARMTAHGIKRMTDPERPYVSPVATDVRVSINRAKARMNLKQFRSVKS